MERTTCCIVGGGPAGMVLGLLLARSGVEVTVLEKHGDFLRDFRGDTVHPSTLSLLDEIGLSEEFNKLPRRLLNQIQVPLPSGEMFTFVDFSKIPMKHNYIAMVPQWDLLNLLAAAGKDEPTFNLRMYTEATELLTENGRVNGVRYRTADGEVGTLRATLTVACDGRNSLVQDLPELGLQEFPCPIDAWWFRMPRKETDPEGGFGNVSDGWFFAFMDRGDYWQIASIIDKGSNERRRAQGIERFMEQFIELTPWMADRKDALTSWDDIKLLDVRLNRLRRWHRPGLLCIGDAAHAMSPVFGIGINLAVQDAVATARILADPLRGGSVGLSDVRRVQRRRWPTTVATQDLQRLVHRRVMEPALRGDIDFREAGKLPLPLRVLPKAPALRRIPGYFLAYGARQEHAPQAARR